MKRNLLVKTVAATTLGLGVIGGLAATATAGVAGDVDSAVSASVDGKKNKPAGDVDGVTETNVLSTAAAMKAARAALDEAEERGQRVTIAIVDRSGETLLLVHGDNAGPQTEDSAVRKAFTAVSFGRATSALTGGATGDAPNISDIPGTLFLAGGVPVAVDDMAIAGIGVGGAPSGEIDEAIANAGLEAIADDLG